MKIALINTYPHGGAGIACRRLCEALQSQGHEVQLLTRLESGRKWPFYAERLSFLPFEKDKTVRFSFSLANAGTDLSQHPAVMAADIIHLHWVNQGFLSLQNIRQLSELGKPVFWTLHDMWAFTGGCHYSRGCRHFEIQCGQCPYVKNPGPNDLSHRIWQKKQRLYSQQLQVITCSEWLAGEARRSGLFGTFSVRAIPNPIDTEIFKPLSAPERAVLRLEMGVAPAARLLLFAAMKVSEERKGFHHLIAALEWLRAQRPDLPLEIMVLGKADPEALAALPYRAHPLGLVKDVKKLTACYGVADVFVIPSLEDNLPNTVMESMACGTPVAGFATGGIPEMTDDGVNGAIAPQGDSAALAAAIERILENDDILNRFRRQAREKVLQHYTYPVVAEQYAAAYREQLGL